MLPKSLNCRDAWAPEQQCTAFCSPNQQQSQLCGECGFTTFASTADGVSGVEKYDIERGHGLD
jgi:hypothetical protein